MPSLPLSGEEIQSTTSARDALLSSLCQPANGSAVSEPHLSVSTESASAASWPAARATGTQCLMNRRACGGAAARHHLSAATTAACQSAAAGHLGTVPESQLMLARTNQTVMLMKRPVAGWNMLNGGDNKCTSLRSCPRSFRRPKASRDEPSRAGGPFYQN